MTDFRLNQQPLPRKSRRKSTAVKRERDKINLATTDQMCRCIFKRSHNNVLLFLSELRNNIHT